MKRSFIRFILGCLPGLLFLAFLCTRCGYNDDPRLSYEFGGSVIGHRVDPGWLDTFRRPGLEEISVASMGERREKLGPFQSIPAKPQMPYRDFVLEYPPLSLPLFVVPRLFTDDVAQFYHLYQLQFALAAVGLALCQWGLLRKLGGAAAERPVLAGLYWSAFILVIGSILVRRIDAVPAMLTGAAVLAAVWKRPFAAGLLLGAGAAVKLWPAGLVPVLLVAYLADRDVRGSLRLLIAATLVPLLSHLALMPSVGMHVLDYLHFHTLRGFHSESIYGNLLVLLGTILRLPFSPVEAHGAWDIAAHGWAAWLLPASSVVLLAAYGGALASTWVAAKRTTLGTPDRSAVLIAAVCGTMAALMTFSKVYSVQYIIWLFPMVVVLSGRLGRRVRICYFIALVLTVAVWKYWNGVPRSLVVCSTVLLVRNLLFASIAWMTLRFCRTPRTEPSTRHEPVAPMLLPATA